MKTIQVWPTDDDALSCAESDVPHDYVGPCAVRLDGDQYIVLPSVTEASIAAKMAINLQIGGYGSAVIVPAKTNEAVTHQTAYEWLFDR